MKKKKANLLMISDKEKLHYLAVKKLSAIFKNFLLELKNLIHLKKPPNIMNIVK